MLPKNAGSGAPSAKFKITLNEIVGSKTRKKKANQASHKRTKKNWSHTLASKPSKNLNFHGWWTAVAVIT